MRIACIEVETFLGLLIDPYSVDPTRVRIEDIAFRLSNTCRFGGFVRRCVAGHSLIVEKIVDRLGGHKQARMHALLHDAHEAYLGDVPTPLKHRPEFVHYREACDRAQLAILKSLHIRKPSRRVVALVKRADDTSMLLEVRGRLPSNGLHWDVPHSARVDADVLYDACAPLLGVPWRPVDAEARFLERYEWLRHALRRSKR